MGFYTVIGLGRFGSEIASKLSEHGDDVLVIDKEEALIEPIADQVTRAVVADATNKDVLRGLGVADSDCAVVAVGSDLASSVLVTMNLKALGVKRVICKAYDELHSEILEKLGADQVVIPEQEMAEKVAMSLTSPDVLEYIRFSKAYGIMELVAPQNWVGKSLKELNVRAKYGVNIIAVRSDEVVLVSVDPERKFLPEDVLVVLGDYGKLDKMKTVS